ncbi:aminopeptidase P family protein [Acinetobacter sp. MD2(2019)]|uniref:aminopeptidase P family protein n=1 Tax=Acinetobacter sp. MD2(2019) TaxID=2605273 RepID=UPI002D1F9379|nr:aminopeptidase P family protein [Acinetobacter sp. MD2(2019)]MEB3753283.1 aminopeptidase P family protein [Acinetobacter sp. MD2(2019)]
MQNQELCVQTRLAQLRKEMQSHGVDAYIIPSADPHMSEYLPEHWQSRSWVSGFTGSVGTLVITANEAGLWVDGRYWVQAAKQLEGTGITLQKQTPDPNSSYIFWLQQHLPEQASIAMDGAVISAQIYAQLTQQLGLRYQLRNDLDLIAAIWTQRPNLPQAPIYALPEHAIAISRQEKIAAVRQALTQKNCDGHFISALDDIAWLLNLRGADVEFNPVFLAHFYLDQHTAILFVDAVKLNSALQAALIADGIQILPYTHTQSVLQNLAIQRLWIDAAKVSIAHVEACPSHIQIVRELNPSSVFKAQKSPLEIENMRQTMLQDGVALVEFFSWFEQALAAKETVTELDIDEHLTAFRAKQKGFLGLSFATIAGFNENGALPHYRATKDAFSVIDGQGLLLIDSGGQYVAGTTDITRVIPIGQPTPAQSRDYTLVLKAHIALAQTVFPEGIAAPLLDSICRKELWQAQLDYRHGTGHGVGFALNVHEGPQVLSYYAPITAHSGMKAGMITSNEPGLYREGQWGIRLENLVVNQPMPNANTGYGNFLYFENLTLCPFDYRCIDLTLLNTSELAWLNAYHAEVWDKLSPYVTGDAKTWLQQMTQALA